MSIQRLSPSTIPIVVRNIQTTPAPRWAIPDQFRLMKTTFSLYSGLHVLRKDVVGFWNRSPRCDILDEAETGEEPELDPAREMPLPKIGLKRKDRKHLVKRQRMHLNKLSIDDIESSPEFKILRYAILNGYFNKKSSRIRKVTIEQLRTYLRNLSSTYSGFKFNIPKKYRRRKVNAMLGEIPFKNLLLWCNQADNFKDAALHLCLAFPDGDCEKEDPKGEIAKLIGTKCREGNCSGIYSVWTFVDPASDISD